MPSANVVNVVPKIDPLTFFSTSCYFQKACLCIGGTYLSVGLYGTREVAEEALKIARKQMHLQQGNATGDEQDGQSPPVPNYKDTDLKFCRARIAAQVAINASKKSL